MAEAEKLLIQAYKERQEGRLKVLVPSYERSESTEETTTREFSSVEEAMAANLPAGTEVIINGRRAIVE